MKTRRPIAVLTTSYPHAEADEAGAFVQGFCRACVRAGYAVEVLCPEVAPGAAGGGPRGGGAPPGPPAPPAQTLSPPLRVRPLSYARPRRFQFLSASPGAPERLAASPGAWIPALAFGGRLTLAVAAGALRRRYGALVSHWLLPSTLAGVLGAPPGLYHVGIAHGSDVHLLETVPGGALLARRILARTHRLVFVSESLRRRFGRLTGARLAGALARRSVVQPMGVEILPDAPRPAVPSAVAPAPRAAADRGAARARLGLAAPGPLLLWMGRLVALKAPQRALQALDRLPGWTLVLAGSGPLADPLRDRAAALGARARLVGFVHGERKAALLSAADVLVHTATTLADGRTDSLPVTVLEALCAGLPVVATAVGGLPSLGLTPREGLTLVPDGDLRALTDALSQAARAGPLPPHVRRAHRARFGWDAALPRILGQPP